MKKVTLTILEITILFFLSQQVFSFDILPENKTIRFENHTAKQYKEKAMAGKREIDFLLAPIKNQVVLKNYLATTPIENTPLGVLPEVEREIFINSLVFTRRGLASFDYSVLSYGPTATEVYNILALFGSQSTTPFLPGLTIASESDNSIMRVAEFVQLNAQLL
ncbi:hypothetical protein, partial [Microbulbifer sp. 2205BS26-8]|uniref:hypothetical protein n=1 Tax=Microbulbifer sp. 2205BS26-8 TaxID=3064386 RepID=UPI00273E2DF1